MRRARAEANKRKTNREIRKNRTVGAEIGKRKQERGGRSPAKKEPDPGGRGRGQRMTAKGEKDRERSQAAGSSLNGRSKKRCRAATAALCSETRR